MITDTFTDTEPSTSAQFIIELWLWPNLVSLDAPAVAVLWQLLLAHCLHLRLKPLEPLVLALAVWSIYASDQILDALRPPTGIWEPARKTFYRRHFGIASLAGLGLVLLVLPLAYSVLERSTFYAGLALGFPVLCYFGLVHLAPPRWRAYWPREAVVASLFTLGTFLSVWIVNGSNMQRLALPAALFSLLCWANCSAIETWEWQTSSHNAAQAPSISARWAARHLSVFAVGVAMLAAVVAFLSFAPMDFCVAVFWSGVALAILGACRSQLPINILRVAADVALCTPLFALAFVWVR